MRNQLLLFFLCQIPILLFGQADFYDSYSFTKADSLRGDLRPERTCYDVTYYELHLDLDTRKRQLRGYVDMHFLVTEDFTRLQFDLYDNMTIDRIEANGQELPFEREANAVFVDFPSTRHAEELGRLRIYYHGSPVTARTPPWDGGFIWSTDRKGRPWIAVACEGDGASLWWPNKDHLSDEPDSVLISIAVPEKLMAVANGNLRSVEEEGKKKRYNWFVSYPINNYNVSINIGHYTHFEDEYYAFDGDTLALDYYVLDYNLERAQTHFEQVEGVLKAYEYYLDKYPFWEDGFCLVETPYLGMEHQSAIAYGNKYMRGYLGGMIPRGMDWDYIIVHETGHEYFGNSVSCNDLSEMWIHESFTTYLEALYVEYQLGYDEAIRYLKSQRPFISNREPVIGPPGVNFHNWDSSDHYFKGSWVLHTLRHAIGDDELWFDLFKGFYQAHAISNIHSEQFFEYVEDKTGKDWSAFFEQYLRYPAIPTLEYRLEEKGKNLKVSYRWKADVADFAMPVLLGTEEAYQRVEPNTRAWQELVLKNTSANDFQAAKELFLMKTKRVKS